jgi:hypothetical protein
MKYLTLVAIFSLSAMLVGCTDLAPTAPAAEDGSVALKTDTEAFGKAAQGDRSDWQLMVTGTITEEWYDNGWYAPIDMRCMNDGAGELAKWYGTYWWYYKETVTPSGNVLQNLRYEIGDDVMMVGQESGEVWYVDRWRSQFHQHTKQANGYTTFVQPDDMWFVNDDGQRMKTLFLSNIVYDESMNVVSDKSKFAVCTIVGH